MKNFLRIGLIVLLILCLGYGLAHGIVRHKIKEQLQEQVQKKRLRYDGFSINLLTGSADLKQWRFNTTSDSISADHLLLHGVGYWSYLMDDKITVDNIGLQQPNIYIKSRSSSSNSSGHLDRLSEVKQSIEIGKIKVDHASLTWDEDSLTKLKLSNYTAELRSIQMDPLTKSEKIPFTYHSLQIRGGLLHYHLNKLQDATVDSLTIDRNNIVLHHPQVLPNYTEKTYVNVIPYEKDLMKIDFESTTINDYSLKLHKSPIRFSAKLLSLTHGDVNIYRDKTVRDDPRHKKLYSAMLRNLGFDLQLDSLQIDKTSVTYREVQENTKKTGKVFFKDMNVSAANITNVDPVDSDFPQTNVDIDCRFMGAAPLHADWRFKVNDHSDRFRIYGQAREIPPRAMNNFFIPAFNMKASGKGVNILAFDFQGDKETAKGNFKMDYDKFKVKALNDKTGRVKEMLSFLANLVVHKKNTTDNGSIEIGDVKRDDTKSFWNYLWRCIFSGLKKTVIK